MKRNPWKVMNNLSSKYEASPFAVELRNVSKFFGPVIALNDITTHIEWGCILAIFGSNGAGKSTLLKTLATLVRPDTGTTTITGLNGRQDANLIRRKVGYLGHQTLLYEDLTVQENLEFYARMYQLNNRRERITQTLQQFELDAFSTQRIRTLSHGIRKRASLARAILHQPEILLLDEPETGLDITGRNILSILIKKMHNDGSLIIITSHSTEWAYELATKIFLLAEGTIILDSTPTDISYHELESKLALKKSEDSI